MKNDYRELISKGITYRTQSTYVDLDTGEIINKSQTKNKEYYVKETYKQTTWNSTRTKCLIRYTIGCRRNAQGKLFDKE